VSLYDKAREGFVAGEIVWKEGGSVIKAALVRGYIYSVAHKFMSDVTGAGGMVVATETLSSLTNLNGVLDAADTPFDEVPEGDEIPHCIIYQASAVTGGADVPPAQQRVIIAMSRGNGLPIHPNGQLITGQWPPGADRIARF
jgi:hypothetical protein